jgi:hypothetical protein
MYKNNLFIQINNNFIIIIFLLGLEGGKDSGS